MNARNTRNVVAVVVLGLALIGGVWAVLQVISRPAARTVVVPPSASTRPAYPHAASTVLGMLDLRRQAAVEADIPDDVRAGMLRFLDETRTKMLAVLDDPALDGATRDARFKEVQEDFQQRGRAMLESGGDAAQRVRDRVGFIWFELDLLSRRRLLPLMFQRLDLTDAQHKSADNAFMEVSVILHNEPAGGLPNEKSMVAMLSGREKLHALLTPQQREKFDQVLHEEQQARATRRLTAAGPASRPTTSATTQTR